MYFINNPSDTYDDHLLGLLKEILRYSITFFFFFNTFEGVKYRNSLQMNSYLSHILKVLDQIILLYLLENLSEIHVQPFLFMHIKQVLPVAWSRGLQYVKRFMLPGLVRWGLGGASVQ